MDVREQFGREAEKYLTSKSHANASELERLVELVGSPGGTVLDIATGAGHVAFAFAAVAEKVVALDLTPEMLAIVDREAKQRGLNIETILGRAEDLPFEDATFEGVACRVAPHHFADPEAYVRESFRILKPGGWFLLVDTIGIDDPTADDALNAFEALRDPSHVRDYTVGQWREWVETVGFAVEHVSTSSFRHELEDWLDRMSVVEPHRTTLRSTVTEAKGPLRGYFEPEDGTFLLHQVTLLGRK